MHNSEDPNYVTYLFSWIPVQISKMILFKPWNIRNYNQLVTEIEILQQSRICISSTKQPTNRRNNNCPHNHIYAIPTEVITINKANDRCVVLTRCKHEIGGADAVWQINKHMLLCITYIDNWSLQTYKESYLFKTLCSHLLLNTSKFAKSSTCPKIPRSGSLFQCWCIFPFQCSSDLHRKSPAIHVTWSM